MSAPTMTEETREKVLPEEENVPGVAIDAGANLTWLDANQRYLAAALSALRTHLQATSPNSTVAPVPVPPEDAVLDPSAWSFSQPPALEQLCSAFELSGFERAILLLAAGAEMDSGLSGLYASMDGNHRALPTLKLALAAIPEAHWSAFSPLRPLRRCELIDLLPGDTLIGSAFRPNERILHFLAGVSGIDERLHHLVRPVSPQPVLPASHANLARQAATAWSGAAASAASSPVARKLPLIELCGTEPDANRAIAAAIAASFHLHLYVLSSRGLSGNAGSDNDAFLRLWEREALLSGATLLVECEDLPADASSAPLTLLIESLQTPLILSSRQPRSTVSRPRAVFYISGPTRAEQSAIWQTCLHCTGTNADEILIGTLASQFNLGSIAIASAAQRVDRAANPAGPAHAATLWEACRIEARPRLQGLAQRVETSATWDDLVLPAKEFDQLRQVSLHVRHRTRVYETWGFADRSSRGLGISALFAGASGTGKTTAAEALAHELRLDLFRIDLSQVISKYIGETEKNLSLIFEAAEQGAAVLLFDEADALFGKRTDVKDSHDRYANCEVSYLLQRMEAYRGLAILTTNRKSSLDQAFLRRLRFVVEFPFPEAAQRAEIWRRVFPPRTPVRGLNIERLARLRISGGNIQNIAMGAAFLAAGAGESVGMEHLVTAARTEFAKLETPLNDSELAGWV